MKKYIPYIIGAVVVLGGIGAFVVMQNNNTNKSNSSSTTTTETESLSFKYKDACKLFTQEQIGAALGGTFGAGEEDIATNAGTPGTPNYEKLKGSACTFDQDNDGSTEGMKNALNLSVAINNHESTEAAKAWMKNLHDPQTSEGQEAMNEPVDVKDVGDEAFFAKVNTGDTGVAEKSEALYARFGNQVIVLTATKLAGIDQDAVQASLTKLAKEL